MRDKEKQNHSYLTIHLEQATEIEIKKAIKSAFHMKEYEAAKVLCSYLQIKQQERCLTYLKKAVDELVIAMSWQN
ncbi:MAG TPA: hypothetical protein VKP03_01150 [Patescibacteria group bacterium]|nr:hypothetical protein [Patescibacteria group bacterium]